MSKNNYVATWFYKEEAADASFYPQGGKGDSPLTHSIYMQNLVPFFTTFRHFNPLCRLMFFTNALHLPDYLEKMFSKLGVTTVRLKYECKPPAGWHTAWMNQFYLYDILNYLKGNMDSDDAVVVSDSDVICMKPIDSFFDEVMQAGSGLYEMDHADNVDINGLKLTEMAAIYENCYKERPSKPLRYYGGDFVALRGDKVAEVSEAREELWEYNLLLYREGKPKLNEEALFLSALAEHLKIRNSICNKYFKRMWTHPHFNTVKPEDVNLSVWHLPYEKKRGLYYLYKHFLKTGYEITDEKRYKELTSFYNGVPTISFRKKLKDLIGRIEFNIKKLKSGIRG